MNIFWGGFHLVLFVVFLLLTEDDSLAPLCGMFAVSNAYLASMNLFVWRNR